MRIGRTLPPAAAPIGIREMVSGFRGIVRGQEELDRFRAELKDLFGVRHCFLVSSGKVAFTLILLALKDLFPGRDTVLIPAFTCYSVPSSIVRAALKIRLCDLHPNTLDFDFAQLSALLSKPSPTLGADTSCYPAIKVSQCETSSTFDTRNSATRLLAVVPTHLFGIPADVPRLRRLAHDPDVTVVEDAAQAMGEAWDGRKLGTLGDVSFFSLGRGKAFSTVEGGVILTDRDDIAEKLERHVADLLCYSLGELLNLVLKAVVLTLFLRPLLFWIPRSMPFLKMGETLFEPHFPMRKMSSFQAGLTRNWRARLQKFLERRKKNVDRWIVVLRTQGFHGLGFQNCPELGLIRFPIRLTKLETRRFLLKESEKKGLGIMPVYPNTIAGIQGLKGFVGAQAFPVAETCARGLVTLPTHNYLTQRDITEISRLLSNALTHELCTSSA
ncbi:MAG: DegT/DnrJ/EryC1/StrS family aminotransferase [Nitrososphaera sp.]